MDRGALSTRIVILEEAESLVSGRLPNLWKSNLTRYRPASFLVQPAAERLN